MSAPAVVRPERESRVRAPVSARALWAAALAGPVAFLVNHQLLYLLVDWTCLGGHRWVMHLTALFFAAVAAAGGLLARRNWARAGREWPTTEGGPEWRSRFLAAFGLLMSAGFFFILAQWFPLWVLDSCVRAG